jgi:hexosaminidase
MEQIPMKNILLALTIVFGSVLIPCNHPDNSTSNDLNIIPKPLNLEQIDGHFSIKNSVVFVTPLNSDLEKIALFFSDKIKTSTGIHIKVATEKPASDYIVLEFDPALALNNEGYLLNVTNSGVTIRAKTAKGIFYGMQTLMQLLPPEIENSKTVANIDWVIPCVNIRDEPRFSWRGMLLDAGRHFISVDFIKKQLDVLAMLKINKFHWHLTEDQGWRIEIKKYPKLTEIGSKRTEEDGSIHQGFYTQEQIKEVVAYAKQRYIDVIPEIEMPGHALAALAAYPALSCTGGPFTPRIVWGTERNVFCAGNDSVFTFLENVLTEVIPLFPYEYFQIGGDECPKDSWNACLKCKARMKNEKIKSSHELQSYFMQRMEKVLIAHGKKMMGWDEILEGGLSPSANVMSWRGEKGGIAAANMGHDVVMSPGKFMYLNFYQGDPKIEPVAKDGFITCESMYNYEPIPSAIEPEKANHILGAQANMWTEYIYNEASAEYQIYPRILALAELTWTDKNKKNYSDFERRLNDQLIRLDGHHINYYIPQPEGPTSQIAFTDKVTLSFSTTLPVERIVYTTDGSAPNIKSTIYEKPLDFTQHTVLKIASIMPQGKMSSIRTITIEKQSYLPSTIVAAAKQGLKCNVAYGYFLKTADIHSIKNWNSSIVDSMAQANTTLCWGTMIDPTNFKAVELSGYIEIPEDGVYFFSSNQDQVWIDDKLLINNDGEVKRDSRRDGSVALAKGKHHLKIIYLNNIVGGWPSDWNIIQLNYRNAKEKAFKKVEPSMCWYK